MGSIPCPAAMGVRLSIIATRIVVTRRVQLHTGLLLAAATSRLLLGKQRAELPLVVGEVGQGWDQVTSELAYERSGPERFLLTFQVFEELARVVGANPSPAASEVLGRLAAQLMALTGCRGVYERGDADSRRREGLENVTC